MNTIMLCHECHYGEAFLIRIIRSLDNRGSDMEGSAHFGMLGESTLLAYSFRYFLKSSVRSSSGEPVEREAHWTRHFL